MSSHDPILLEGKIRRLEQQVAKQDREIGLLTELSKTLLEKIEQIVERLPRVP